VQLNDVGGILGTSATVTPTRHRRTVPGCTPWTRAPSHARLLRVDRAEAGDLEQILELVYVRVGASQGSEEGGDQLRVG
jgi:hypothetical protein